MQEVPAATATIPVGHFETAKDCAVSSLCNSLVDGLSESGHGAIIVHPYPEK
jgi:hypothetical protein